MSVPNDGPALSARNLIATEPGHLALALLTIELLAGMQTFLAATVTPLIATELHGQQLYGAATAVSMVAAFLTMPLAGPLMRRYSPGLLLTVLTPVSVVAGVIGSLSPTMWVYIASRLLSGLAAGALMGVSMGAVATGLPTAWRQLVLAANNLMWVISALFGPAYAAWISHVLSWRWALVLYLPFLVLARWVVARKLPPHAPDEDRVRLPVGLAVVLATGVSLTLALSVEEWWRWPVAVGGVSLVAYAMRRLLPAGVLSMRPGGRAGIATVGVVTAAYGGPDALVSLVGHDVLDFDERGIGWALTAGALMWSLVGLACGRWPATGRRFLRRGMIGTALLTLGIALMAWSAWSVTGWAWYLGIGVLGCGIGAVYLDAMNAAFTPDAEDPLAPTDAASSLVLCEQLAWALPGAVLTSLFASNPATAPVGILACLVLVAVAGIGVVRTANVRR